MFAIRVKVVVVCLTLVAQFIQLVAQVYKMIRWSVKLCDLCSVLRNNVLKYCLMEWIIKVHSGLLA